MVVHRHFGGDLGSKAILVFGMEDYYRGHDCHGESDGDGDPYSDAFPRRDFHSMINKTNKKNNDDIIVLRYLQDRSTRMLSLLINWTNNLK